MPRIEDRIYEDGAFVSVDVGIDVDLEESLRQAGRPIPSAYAAPALIDTGASRSAIHPWLAEHLGSPPGTYVTVLVPGGDGEKEYEVPVHDLRVWLLAHTPPLEVLALAVASVSKGALFIIGRDILDHCQFHYDGPNRTFRLDF